MTVEQDVRTAVAGRCRMVGDDDWMTIGRADLGGKAKVSELCAYPPGGTQAILPVVRLGADRGNAQELEQPLTGGVERCIGMAQYGGNRIRGRGHEDSCRLFLMVAQYLRAGRLVAACPSSDAPA